MDQRVATVREFVASVFNGHEPDLAREYMTPDVVWHGNTVGTIAGVDTVVAVLGGFIGALPDIHAEEQDVIASDDLVAVRLVVSATQTGPARDSRERPRRPVGRGRHLQGHRRRKDQRAVGLRGHGCHRQPARRVHAAMGGLKR